MRESLALLAFLLFSLPCAAQDTPPGEVGVGYTFRSYGYPSFQQPPARLGMNGWNVTVDYNFRSRIGAALNVDWTGNTSNGGETDVATAMLGPQIYPFGHRKLTLFAHALFGAARFYFRDSCGCFSANAGSNYFSEYAFAWALGGGLDYTIRPNVGIRFGQIDFEQVHFNLEDFGRGSIPAQNDWKYSAAVLLRF
jgi:opacity protein-like surface antigen